MKKVIPQTQFGIEQKTLDKNWEKLRGSIVMVVGNEIFSTKRAKNVNKMLKDIEKRFNKQPLITYIPKEGTLILLI